MSEITLTINGKQVRANRAIPFWTFARQMELICLLLCHYKGLTDVGACRMCLVEIEKERKPVPACTYPGT